MTNTGGTPAGWYHAQGDPDGTQRYWDGAQWIGDPLQVPQAQPRPEPQQNPPASSPPPTDDMTVQYRRPAEESPPSGFDPPGSQPVGGRPAAAPPDYSNADAPPAGDAPPNDGAPAGPPSFSPPSSGTPDFAPPGYVAFDGPGAAQSGQPSGLAEPFQRIVARLVDGIIWIAIGLVVAVAFGGDAITSGSDVGYLVGLLASLVGLALILVYEVLLTTRTGNTLGKKIFNTKIVNVDGSDVDVQTMLRRMSPYIGLSLLSAFVPVVGAWLGFIGILAISIVSIVFLFTDAARQAVWDRIATTKVVVD